MVGSAHNAIFARNTEAALCPDLLAGGLDYLWVNKLNYKLLIVFPDICLQNEHRTAQYADLRRRKADTACISKRICHIVEKLMKSLVKLHDRSADLAKYLIFLSDYVSQCHIVHSIYLI